VFFGIGDSIYAVDALAPTFSARIVAGQVIPYAAGYEWGLAMGTCRKLLVGTHDSILEVDIDSGVSTVAIAAPQLLGGYQPYVGCVAYNAWTDEVAYHHNTPYYWVPVGPLHGATSTNWRVAFSGIYPQQWLLSLSTTAEIPFQYIGRGCTTSAGREPRMLWSGLPLQGTAFSLSVRDTEPNGVAIFWLGTSETQWPGAGPLPLDLSFVGAPSCTAYASADFTVLAATDASGLATVSMGVPTNAILHGMPFFAQTASLTRGNALGLVTSDAVAGRIR